MKKTLKWVVIILVAGFGLLQFTNPARTNPPVINDLVASTTPPPAVATLLHAACYDCHSHETKWPLYSKIAPSSWLVVGDVIHGRHNMNFSDWPTNSLWAAKRLENMNDEIDSREMPPKKYTLMHSEARLTDAQIQTLLDWTSAEAKTLKSLANNNQ